MHRDQPRSRRIVLGDCGCGALRHASLRDWWWRCAVPTWLSHRPPSAGFEGSPGGCGKGVGRCDARTIFAIQLVMMILAYPYPCTGLRLHLDIHLNLAEPPRSRSPSHSPPSASLFCILQISISQSWDTANKNQGGAVYGYTFTFLLLLLLLIIVIALWVSTENVVRSECPNLLREKEEYLVASNWCDYHIISMGKTQQCRTITPIYQVPPPSPSSPFQTPHTFLCTPTHLPLHTLFPPHLTPRPHNLQPRPPPHPPLSTPRSQPLTIHPDRPIQYLKPMVAMRTVGKYLGMQLLL